MRVILVSRDEWAPHPKVVVDQLPATLGRGGEADVSLEEPWTSHAHCEISEEDGALVVRDLESRNGTFVNGQAITESRLAPGDSLMIGLTSYEVYCRSRTPESSVA